MLVFGFNHYHNSFEQVREYVRVYMYNECLHRFDPLMIDVVFCCFQGVGAWTIDPKSGIPTAISGVTNVMESYEEADVNFAGDVTYITVGMSNRSYAAIDLRGGTIKMFNVSRPPGITPGDINIMPTWLGTASSSRMLGWSRYEIMGGPSIVLTETLIGEGGSGGIRCNIHDE